MFAGTVQVNEVEVALAEMFAWHAFSPESKVPFALKSIQPQALTGFVALANEIGTTY